MCGIFGALNTNKENPHNISALAYSKREAILDSLRHRGEDGEGIFKSEQCFLAHTRLAILDPLPRAAQPYTLGDITLVFNGEIYNYRELAKKYDLTLETSSDTEVVIRLYELLGDQFVELLDGMFALGIYDKRNGTKLLLARDRAGEKPLYYTRDTRGIAFASTTKALLTSRISSKNLNKQALWDFFTFLWIPEPATIFEDIFALPPGHILVFERKNIEIKAFKNRFHAPLSEGKSSRESIRNMVTNAIKARLLSDVKIGAFLSGGVDSSIVCAIAHEEIPDLATFSVGFLDDFDPYTGYADETKYAESVARFLGTQHHSIMIKARDFEMLLKDFVRFCDQPFGVISALGVLCVAKEAKKRGIKVLLSGDGADEVFGGYPWHVKVRNNPPTINPEKPKGWHYYATQKQKSEFLCEESFKYCASSLRFLLNNLDATPKEYLLHDLEFYLKNEMMSKLDRMTMAYSIEGRAAFVAPKLLEFAEYVDYEWLLSIESEKPRLKEAFDDLLPAEVFSRPKHGFNPPINHWLKHEWLGILKESLSKDSCLFKYNILSAASAERFWKYFREDECGGSIGFCFIVLNMWLRELEEEL